MDRRSFIRNSSLAGIGLTALPLSAGIYKEKSVQAVQPFEDDFLLNEATIMELQKVMSTGQQTAVSLANMYLERIKQVDKSGPMLNAVIEINPDAVFMVEQMDKERSGGKVRGPLHGIPIMIKDNIDTGDKMQTTAGSLALEGHRARKDAFVIGQLRKAGVVLLGKTNLSEWANFRSEKSTSGWSSRGGLTKNPCMLDHNPSGSSSGSAVSVAANLCCVAVGTETDGSIVSPASCCGIAGLKPTVGLVSRTGIIPISHNQDTAGPMARTVEDIAILLGAMTGVDTEDRLTIESIGHNHTDYTLFLDKNSLQGSRLGYDKKWKSTDNKLNKIFEETMNTLDKLGAVLVEVEISDKINELNKPEFEVLKYDFKNDLNAYLEQSGAKVRSLKEIIEFNRNNAEQAMPFFQQDIMESAKDKAGLDSKDYLDTLQKIQSTARDAIHNTLNKDNLSAIIGLTSGPACVTDLVYGDRYGDVYTGTAPAISGFPHITVPCGTAYQLPVGLSFYAGPYSEPVLLGLAYAYEQATKKRQKPGFFTTMDIK